MATVRFENNSIAESDDSERDIAVGRIRPPIRWYDRTAMTNFELLESGEGGHKKSRLKLGLYKKKNNKTDDIWFDWNRMKKVTRE